MNIEPGAIVEIVGQLAFCRRIDGTGYLSIPAGSRWYVDEVTMGVDKDLIHIDDRNRPDLDDDPEYCATVWRCNVRLVGPLEQLAEQAELNHE